MIVAILFGVFLLPMLLAVVGLAVFYFSRLTPAERRAAEAQKLAALFEDRAHG